jgi:hypothetical protein
VGPQTVAGESIDVLVEALAAFEVRKTRAGRVGVTAQLDRDIGQPLQRAIMRIESELLAHDADLIGTSGAEIRTPGERRADALIALVLRVADARGR